MTITKTGLSYTATSLEDIAQEFERRGLGLLDRVGDLDNHRERGKLTDQSEVWIEAAAILRATKLEPPECEGRTITGADLAESALKLKAAWDGVHISNKAFNRIAADYVGKSERTLCHLPRNEFTRFRDGSAGLSPDLAACDSCGRFNVKSQLIVKDERYLCGDCV